MSDTDITAKLKQAIAAAKSGDHDTARDLLQDITDEDPENARAWLWMARVVDNEDEKRICLTNVLQLAPGNAQAQKMLDALENKAEAPAGDEEVYPGIKRRQLTITVVGGLLFGIFACAISLLLANSTNTARFNEAASATAAKQQQEEQETAIAAGQTATSVELTEEVTYAYETAIAENSPTPTASRTPNLPPTFTPTPEPTVDPGVLPLEGPPPLPGSIITWGGRDVLNVDFLEPRLYTLEGGVVTDPTILNEDLIQQPALHPTGQRVAYMRYIPAINDWSLFAVNIDGTQPEELSTRWEGQAAIVQPRSPRFSADGTQLVMAGTDFDNRTIEIWVLNLGTNEVTRVTNDAANYSDPVLSPDGTEVIAVREAEDTGVDLVRIDIASGTQTPLTDDGNTGIESSPDWSSDGTRIVYSVASSSSPDNGDLLLQFADGRGEPLTIVQTESDEILPVFSPDANYVAYSNNRTGIYEVYIFELDTGSIWQLTNLGSEQDSFVSSWSER